MLVAYPDLQFLSAVLVLLWPLGVVFPIWQSVHRRDCIEVERPSLDNLAVLDDALDLVNHQRANAHCTSVQHRVVRHITQMKFPHFLSGSESHFGN